MKRYDVRPSRRSSKLVYIMGMCIIGFVIIGIIPISDTLRIALFIVWIMCVIGTTTGIMLYHVKKLLAKKDIPTSHFEIMEDEKTCRPLPFDEKLYRLESLKNDGNLEKLKQLIKMVKKYLPPMHEIS